MKEPTKTCKGCGRYMSNSPGSSSAGTITIPSTVATLKRNDQNEFEIIEIIIKDSVYKCNWLIETKFAVQCPCADCLIKPICDTQCEEMHHFWKSFSGPLFVNKGVITTYYGSLRQDDE